MDKDNKIIDITYKSIKNTAEKYNNFFINVLMMCTLGLVVLSLSVYQFTKKLMVNKNSINFFNFVS